MSLWSWLIVCLSLPFRSKHTSVCAAIDEAKWPVVMRAWGVGYEEAQNFVKGKRPMARPNDGFCEQLRVWQACEYALEHIVDGRKRDKAPYVEWKRKTGIVPTVAALHL